MKGGVTFYTFMYLLALLCLSFTVALPAAAQESPQAAAEDAGTEVDFAQSDLFKGTSPKSGPYTADLGSQGKVAVPEGNVFFQPGMRERCWSVWKT